MAGQPQQTGPTPAEWEERKSSVPVVDGGFAETDASQLMTKCNMLSQSDALPDCYRGSPANILVAAELAHNLGVGLGVMLQNSFVLKGKIHPMVYLLLGCCQRSPLFDHKAYKLWTTGTRYEDTFTWYCQGGRVGGEVMEFTYSVAQAKTANLWGKVSKDKQPLPWAAHPDDMGTKMPIARMMRRLFADLTMGLVTAEEIAHAKAVDDAVGDLELDDAALTKQLTTQPEPGPVFDPEKTNPLPLPEPEPVPEPVAEPATSDTFEKIKKLYNHLNDKKPDELERIRTEKGFGMVADVEPWPPEDQNNLLIAMQDAVGAK